MEGRVHKLGFGPWPTHPSSFLPLRNGLMTTPIFAKFAETEARRNVDLFLYHCCTHGQPKQITSRIGFFNSDEPWSSHHCPQVINCVQQPLACQGLQEGGEEGSGYITVSYRGPRCINRRDGPASVSPARQGPPERGEWKWKTCSGMAPAHPKEHTHTHTHTHEASAPPLKNEGGGCTKMRVG